MHASFARAFLVTHGHPFAIALGTAGCADDESDDTTASGSIDPQCAAGAQDVCSSCGTCPGPTQPVDCTIEAASVCPTFTLGPNHAAWQVIGSPTDCSNDSSRPGFCGF